MDKRKLPNVTLLGIDCVDLKRLQLAADISTKEIEFGAIKLLSSIPSNDFRVVPIRKIKSGKDYSDFMIKELDNYIDTEFVLIFQYDGFILNPSAWSDEFLKYDYIGSPWANLGELKVGNGGFSLRSKKLTSWLKNNWRGVKIRIHPEDIFISKFVRPLAEKEGIIYAPEDVATKFGKEGNENTVFWNGEFGFHGITYTDISNWLDQHPEYKNSLTYELDDYVQLMRKYPIYDGTVHTFTFRKQEMKDYTELSKGNRGYVAKITKEKYKNWNNVQEGHTIVFKRSGVSFNDIHIPAFERRVSKIERFHSFTELRNKYPNLKISYPLQNIKKWQRYFIKFFGDWIYPRNVSYSIFWLK